MNENEYTKFRESRKRTGKRIDPAKAIITFWWCQIADPYGIRHVPKECDCVGRVYLARKSRSNSWVAFEDLPDETREALGRENPLR